MLLEFPAHPQAGALRYVLELAQLSGLIKEIRPGNPWSCVGLKTQGE
jgi:hypothetical protein